jgi:molybdopterin molybdotransferase
MDGFAVRGADLSPQGLTRLRRIGEAYAGRAFEGTPGKGECVRIMTGAVMPSGTDTVIVQEVCKAEGDDVLIQPGQKPGENVRFAGEDLARGHIVLRAGQAIRPAELGLIASMGYAEIPVLRRLRVAFFSTGDELTSIGEPLRPGQVYDSNR